MSTVYYSRTKRCECCGRNSITKIGQKSSGWNFIFENDSPVRSWSAWKEYLSNEDTYGGDILDEYGKEVSLESFIAIVESDRGGKEHGKVFPAGSRLDQDGYSFV